jgi:hypothetical protein
MPGNLNSAAGAPPTALSVRIVHAAMAAGIILFGIVAHFVLVPKANPSGGLAPLIPWLLVVALGLCVVSFLILRRVPRPETGESVDAFWKRAGPPVIVWAPLEGAALLCVVLYAQTGSKTAIAVAVLPIVLLVLLKPAYFERR